FLLFEILAFKFLNRSLYFHKEAAICSNKILELVRFSAFLGDISNPSIDTERLKLIKDYSCRYIDIVQNEGNTLNLNDSPIDVQGIIDSLTKMIATYKR
ncbi:MAG: hypothetical protein KF690_12475, partial [Bacteroidetes bacterium]|nr:hypothetical protein [Bacteroidota bacterium]